MNDLRPVGKIVAELLLKLKASVATSEVLEASGIRPRMFPAEISVDSRDRGPA